MNVLVVDINGKKVGSKILPKTLFGVEVRPKLMTQALRVYVDRQHQGTRRVKTRGEVSLTSAKVWRQKGTGRARHGSRRAPIFVGGGKAHGPKGEITSLRLNKKMRRLALLSSLSEKAKNKSIVVVSGIEKMKPKTSQAIKILQKVAGFETGDSILLVMPEKLGNVVLAHRNLTGVMTTQARQLNIYEIVRHKKLVLMEESIGVISDNFSEKKVVKRKEKLNEKLQSKPKVGSKVEKKVKKTSNNKSGSQS